ncbi:uncharacterized protein LOC135339747 isoform X1 [Halichondria panicea]|uniref:uncharacterized protein LOC135339747 isoform X1 n=1 Tax=Halichondria panicea TaxID=6063 RepID=UPI00312BC96E
MAYFRKPTHAEAEAAIRELVSTLQLNLSSYTHPNIRVSEIVKAGSMGHGTIVPGSFDIDLVLYSHDVSGDTIITDGYDQHIRRLEAFISNRQVFGAGVITEPNITRYAVQFKYKSYIDVDLLISPVWWSDYPNDPTMFFRFLRDSVPRYNLEVMHRFSVNASKWQVEFMRKKDQKVKVYIVRAKAWRNRLLPKSRVGRRSPSSFLISLLVLRAYENQQLSQTYGYRGHNEARSTTEELKKLVRNHSRMDIYWEDYYKARDYPTLFPSSTPRLVDPANPANNVYLSGIGTYPPNKRPSENEQDWSQFVDKVQYFDLEKSVEEITR